MKITYVHQYFRRPEEGGALRSWRIARAMVAAGHEVTMITAHDGPRGVVEEEGMTIHFLPVPYDNSFSALQRIRSFLRFLRQAKRVIADSPVPDLLYLTSTPLTVGGIGPWASKKCQVPYIFEVRDLWPEAPIQMGVIRHRLLIRWLRNWEKKIYAEAAHLIALSPGMEQGIRTVFPDAAISMIPNMADREMFGNLPEKPAAEKRLGLKPSFRLSYIGAMGLSNGLEKIIQLAEYCTELPIEFVLAGEGGQKASLQQQAWDLNSVTFLPHLSTKEVSTLLAASDLVIVSFADIPILQTNSPNKFFDGLAAGKGILAATDGWVADLVTTNSCGIHLTQDTLTEVRDHLASLARQPGLVSAMGAASRKLAEDFDAKRLCQQIVEIVSGQALSDPARP